MISRGFSNRVELDKADLDFGIHRIIKSKHTQIQAYLNERLPSKVKKVLGDLAQAESGDSLADLKRQIISTLGQEAFAEDGSLSPLYESTPLGKSYVDALKKLLDEFLSRRVLLKDLNCGVKPNSVLFLICF